MNNVLTAGRAAVITGGASGIGLAAAAHFAGLGMHVCVADVNDEQLADARALLEKVDGAGSIICTRTDVSDLNSVESLRDEVTSTFNDIAVVMNNAGIGAGGGAFGNLSGWQKVMAVNLWGVIHGVQTFTPLLVEQQKPAAIINTGSKQGLTNPPGNAAYNVTKAGIRALTESLAYELRNIDRCAVSAHLLVPGFTYTGLISKHIPEKPPGAWTPEQVVAYMVEKLAAGDFYILCPDNDVSVQTDHLRLRWNTEDVVKNRPALSRWHPDYTAEFEAFVNTPQD